MHVKEAQVQQMLHGELDAPSHAAMTQHLAECPACAVQLETATRDEAWLLETLREVDHATPTIALDALVRRAQERPRQWHWQRRAAAVLLALGAATAGYALPGSPLPLWTREAAKWIAGTLSDRQQAPSSVVAPAPDPAEPAAGAAAGIALPPGDRFAIRFSGTQAGGIATLTLTSDPRVIVRAVNGQATFTAAGDHLTIDNRGSTADYAIEVPRLAPSVEVYVGARRVVTIRDGRVIAAPGIDQRLAGDVRIPLSPR